METIINIYGGVDLQSSFNTDRLCIEISGTHIACLVKTGNYNKIAAFELFEFNDLSERGWYKIFNDVKAQSKILQRSYCYNHVFYNLGESIIVPNNLLPTEEASYYLGMVHGDLVADVLKQEPILVRRPLTNVYKIQQHLHDVVHINFTNITEQHIFSIIIEDIFSTRQPLPTLYCKVQVYPNSFVIAFIYKEQLLLIQHHVGKNIGRLQSFIEQVVTAYQLHTQDATLSITGIVKETTITNLKKYFSHVTVECLPTKDIFDTTLNLYPAHYFVPYFNFFE